MSRNFINVILSIRFGISSRTCVLRVSGNQFFKLFEMKKIGEFLYFYVFFVNISKMPKWP